MPFVLLLLYKLLQSTKEGCTRVLTYFEHSSCGLTESGHYAAFTQFKHTGVSPRPAVVVVVARAGGVAVAVSVGQVVIVP